MFAPLLLSLSLSLPMPLLKVAPPAVTPAADPVPVLDEDADVIVDYDLAIDLADSEIDVDMNVDIAYTKPNEQDGNRITRFFMTEWHAFLPSSASDITVSDADGPLSFTIDPVEQPGVVLVKVDFRQDLSSGQSVALLLSYSLPSEPPPVALDDTVELILEDQVVVNAAAAAWAFYSDPRADTWTAEFTLPPGFVAPLDNEVWRQRDGTRVLEAEGDEFVYDFVVVENDAAMSESVVAFDGHEITVRHWPGDDIWQEQVAEQIVDRLPGLIELVGRNWPDRPLVIQQSAKTLGTSYGGWYTSGDHRITIGRSISPELILHELSHVWFHYGNVADRWLVEGLADEFAALAAHGTSGGPRPEAAPNDEVAFDLADWTDPDEIGVATDSRPEAERWAYQASWHVTRATREMIGVDAFTAATRDILGGGRSYPGPDDDGPRPIGPRDWREFLDLASDHAERDADTDVELAELYANWVEGRWTGAFEQRMTARERYRRLEDRAEGRVLPAIVRDEMRAWNFPAANEAMDRTEPLLDLLATMAVRLSERDLEGPADLDDQLARFATVDDIDTYRSDYLAAGDALLGFVDRVDDLDRRQQIGLIGSDLEQTRMAAIDAFAAGEFTAVARLVDDGEAAVATARREGTVRIGAALAALVGGVAVTAWILRRRRGRNAPPADGSVDPPPAPTVIELADGSDGSERAVSPDGYSSSSAEITTSQRS